MEHVTILLSAIVPIIIGTVSQPLAEMLFKAHTMIDKLPALAKRIAVVVIAYAIALLAGFLNAPLPESLEIFASGHVEAALAAGFAMIVHQSGK